MYLKCTGWHMKANTVCMILATFSHTHALSKDISVDVSLVESGRKSWPPSGFGS